MVIGFAATDASAILIEREITVWKTLPGKAS